MFSDLPWYGKVLALVAFFAIMTASSASAYWQDGNKLYDQCEAQINFGVGYMQGAVDALALAMNEGTFCIPPTVTGKQLRDVVCRDLRENPKDRNLLAALLVFRSVQQAWPCK
ncbi:Rap1a/Tai family immunity protein [Kaistia granuli]|uniref:Rap1a/Tai family immunity protein n=1 Tax=Kaistia granuli TaxID=363259 RepID=UPI000371655B